MYMEEIKKVEIYGFSLTNLTPVFSKSANEPRRDMGAE